MVVRREGRDACRSRPARMVVVVLAVAVLAIYSNGCQKADSATALKDRAGKYWELKQSKGWEEIYDQYLDPTVRLRLTKEAFLKRRRLAFDVLSYEISEVQEKENDTATVGVNNEINFPLKTPTGELMLIKKSITTTDQWVRREGTWYVALSE